jgi:hypothetical protein
MTPEELPGWITVSNRVESISERTPIHRTPDFPHARRCRVARSEEEMTELKNPPETDEGGSSRGFHLEIFLMAFASLLLEVSYTRIISFKLYYYYTYLIIGLALLGLGCGGVVVTVSTRLRLARTETIIRWGLLTASVTTFLGYFIVARTPINTINIWKYWTATSFKNLALLVIICVAIFASFIAIGVMVATLFGRRTSRVGRLYAADLVGAGLACALIVFLLSWVGPVVTVMYAALILAFSGLRLSLARDPDDSDRRSLGVSRFLGAAMSVVIIVMLVIPNGLPDVRADETKNITNSTAILNRGNTDIAAPTPPRLTSEWGALFRVDSYDLGDRIALLHDGMLGSAIYRWNGDPASLTRFDNDPRLFPFSMPDAPKEHVLIIGAAGGNEILASLHFGADTIDAIELNPVTYSLLTDRFADFSGHLAENPHVNYRQGDGRTYLDRSSDTYNLIWYPAPDSYSATNAAASGAFVLSESYLYTSNIIEQSLDHLTSDGIVVAQFGEIDYDKKANRTDRYVATARQALENQGVADPGSHIVVITSKAKEVGSYSTVMVKKDPYTPAQIADLQAAVAIVPDSQLRWAPGPGNSQPGDSSAQIASLPPAELTAFLDHYPYEVDAINDNRPFFWHFASFTDVIQNYAKPLDQFDLEDSLGERVLLLLLALAATLGAIFLLVPFVVIRPTWKAFPKKANSALYFAAIGFGFMFFEIPLIQRLVLFLGFPTYSLSVTLASLLTFTGVGAFFSGRVVARTRRILAPLAGCLALLTLFYLFALPAITDSLLGWPLAARILVTFVVLAPLGVTLGLMMPLGLAAVSGLTEFHREYVAWGWAVNGFASVTGAVATTLLAMTFGFNVVLTIAFGFYVIAIFALRALTSARSTISVAA